MVPQPNIQYRRQASRSFTQDRFHGIGVRSPKIEEGRAYDDDGDRRSHRPQPRMRARGLSSRDVPDLRLQAVRHRHGAYRCL